MLNAKAEDLREHLNLIAVRGEVRVRFWLKPGDAPVELALGEAIPAESVPGTLEDMF